MLKFPVERQQMASIRGRKKYLSSASGYRSNHARLCHVLEKVNQNLGSDYLEHGYPWLTLVIGSGCLEARDADNAQMDQVPAGISAALQQREPLRDGTDPATLAESFAQALIEDRLWSSRDVAAVPAAGAVKQSAVADSTTAGLVLAAAIFTRLYYEVSALQQRPLSRAGSDDAVLRADSSRVDALQLELIDPLLQLVTELDDAARGDDDAVLKAGLEGVRAGLLTDNHTWTFSRAHLRLLTELAWYYLTKGTGVYPGWSDLLQELSMTQLVHQDHPSLLDYGRTRPNFSNIAQAPRAIEERYHEVTEDSWSNWWRHRNDEGNDEGIASSRTVFYDSVAHVLRTQASARRQVTEFKKTPPVASIFLTTFDLELEMALWSAGAEPFVVAMPVNLMKAGGASTCWLGCVITPDHRLGKAEQLRALRHPAPESWFLMSAETYFAGSERGNMPVVVRLNGCPLIALPSLTREECWTPLALAAHTLLFHAKPPDVLPEGVRQKMSFEHGVLLDEYSAMQQTAAGFFYSSPTGHTGDVVKFGLPDELAGGVTSAFQRFWMVMGVQIADRSVRSRFVYQMVAQGMYSDGPLEVPLRSGVVVNRREIDASARDLLYWYNYDVVVARCEEFREDLDHYAEHLGPTFHPFASDKICPMDQDDD